MELDDRVRQRYERDDSEDQRLWEPGRGDLIRLRTWDVFDRTLRGPRVADIGGGPGTHAAHLADQGFDVVLVDPIPRHVERARQRAAGSATFDAQVGDARNLDLPDAAFDSVLLMGPLYHLTDAEDRARALREAARILVPGGQLVAEVITRHAWILDATLRGLLDAEGIWSTFDANITTGLSVAPSLLQPGGFWAYFHRVDELEDELSAAGFRTERLIGVEGTAWLLPDLAERMKRPEPLLRAMRLIESEPSLLGVSAHVMAIATLER